MTDMSDKKEDNSRAPTDKTLIQYAQKCAWCNEYLCNDEIIVEYNGPYEEYFGWLCHLGCNLVVSAGTKK